MRKSNWIILGILVVASIFFLWLWYYLQFNLVDNPRDLVLTIIWWVVVIAACLGIHKAEKKRQERIRTTFLAKDCFWNSEAGVAALEGVSAVEGIEQALAALEYNFDLKDFPEKDEVKFDYIVRSAKFEFKKEDEQQDEQGAEGVEASETASAEGEAAEQQPQQQIEVTEWEGEVAVVARPDDDPLEFHNRDELIAILGGEAPEAAAA